MTSELTAPSGDMASTSSSDMNDHYRSEAAATWADDDLQIDPEARVSASADGAWVAAWVWVPAPE